jgi:hypothetical protein
LLLVAEVVQYSLHALSNQQQATSNGAHDWLKSPNAEDESLKRRQVLANCCIVSSAKESRTSIP